MGFKQTLVAGTNLVREAIQSPGFIAGIIGWSINRDGTAEFNSALFRGSIQVGSPPNPYILIDVVGTQGIIFLFSGDPAEITPAQIKTTALPTAVRFFSPDLGNGYSLLKLQPEVTATATPSSAEFAPGGAVTMAMKAKIFGDLNVQPGSGFGGNATITGTLSVGGDTTIGGTASVTGDVDVSGGLTVFGAAGIVSGAMAATDGGTTAGPITTTSTSYVTLGGAPSLTASYPASGRVLVLARATMSSSVGAAGNGAFMSFEARDGTSGGPVRVAATDNNSAYVLNTLLNQGVLYTLLTGLPTTGNVFIRPMFRSQNAASTATYRLMNIIMIPLP